MATDTSTEVIKFHLSINVSNLDRSIAFYSILFNGPPAKKRHDYAKFESLEPPLVLSLSPTHHSPGGALNHLGVRLLDSDTLVDYQRRFEAAGIATQREEGVACCYARQTKFWVTDPDKNLWELYILHEDLEERGDAVIPGQAPVNRTHSSVDTVSATRHDASPADSSTSERAIWQHIIMQPLPSKIECADESLDEVRLEGSFNLRADGNARQAFARELFRVLRPGGTAQVHALVCDRPLTVKPMLPGPASLVEYVPLEHEALDLLTSVGFVEGRYTVLGESACFNMAGAEMREMKLVVIKPRRTTGEGKHRVLYKGPLAQVVDDAGNVYLRGRRVEVDSAAWENLQQSPAADQFVFLECSAKSGGCRN